MVCEERLSGLMNQNGFLQSPRGRIGGRSSRDAIAVGNFLASEPAASASQPCMACDVSSGPRQALASVASQGNYKKNTSKELGDM